MALAPAGNDDAILRWNACVRLMEQNPHLVSETEEAASESASRRRASLDAGDVRGGRATDR